MVNTRRSEPVEVKGNGKLVVGKKNKEKSTITDSKTTGKTTVAAKPAQKSIPQTTVPPQWEVDQIVGEEYKDGEHFYLVKWKGVDEHGKPWESTWEPEGNLDCEDLVVAFLNSESNSSDAEHRKSSGPRRTAADVVVKRPRCHWRGPEEWFCECGDTGCGSEPDNKPPSAGGAYLRAQFRVAGRTVFTLTTYVSILEKIITVIDLQRAGLIVPILRSVLNAKT